MADKFHLINLSKAEIDTKNNHTDTIRRFFIFWVRFKKLSGLRSEQFPKINPIMSVWSQNHKISYYKQLSPKSEPHGRVLLKFSGVGA